MKYLAIKLAALFGALALTIAHTSTTACLVFTFGEPKMPKSLYIAKE